MTESLESLVAHAMEIEPESLPILPDLLDGLEELGSDPPRLIALLERTGFTAGSALDLGCGKGAIAIALARRGVRVLAIDAMASFVDHARRRATREGLADHCEFRCADLRDATALGRRFDLVCLVSVGAVWGSLQATLEALRSLSRGLLLYEDAWLPDGDDPPEGHEDVPGFDALVQAFRGAGLEVAAVDTPSIDEVRGYNRRDLDAIERAAHRLAQQRPEHADAIERYLAEQRRQCSLMNSGAVRASSFVLRAIDPAS